MTTSELDDIRIHMTPDERALFEKYVRKSRFYLEYGCGGSTEAAVRLKVGRVFSVESDQNWIKQLSEKPEISAAIEAGRLRFLHADVGPVGSWGTPTDRKTIDRWPKYFLGPFEKFSVDFDTVLIDGRFRIGCALACHAFLKDDAIMMMHDYQARDGYSEVEKFFEIIEFSNNLFVFRKQKVINPRSYYTAVLNSMFRP